MLDNVSWESGSVRLDKIVLNTWCNLSEYSSIPVRIAQKKGPFYVSLLSSVWVIQFSSTKREIRHCHSCRNDMHRTMTQWGHIHWHWLGALGYKRNLSFPPSSFPFSFFFFFFFSFLTHKHQYPADITPNWRLYKRDSLFGCHGGYSYSLSLP